MILKRVFSFVCGFITPRGQPLINVFLPKRLPTVMAEVNSDSASCCVCLSGINEENERWSLPCLHEFHKICIQRWFRERRQTCPLCRFSVGGDEKGHAAEDLTEEMAIWFSSFHVAGF